MCTSCEQLPQQRQNRWIRQTKMRISKKESLSRVIVPFLSVVLLCGCAARKGSVPDTLALGENTEQERFIQDYRSAGSSRMQTEWGEQAGELVVDTAKIALGTAYVFGGTTLKGFDCSGLVQWAYKHLGVHLPRTAREQSRVGEAVTSPEDLRTGDIVAFHHPRRGYHTGIYTGDGQFIHSPRRRSSVKIASLSNPYFKKTFLGARRVSIPHISDISTVKKRLAASKAEKNSLLAMRANSDTRGQGNKKAGADISRKKAEKKQLKRSSASVGKKLKGKGQHKKITAQKKKTYVPSKKTASLKKTASRTAKIKKSARTAPRKQMAKSKTRTARKGNRGMLAKRN